MRQASKVENATVSIYIMYKIALFHSMYVIYPSAVFLVRGILSKNQKIELKEIVTNNRRIRTLFFLLVGAGGLISF